jgi:hypothetical protein
MNNIILFFLLTGAFMSTTQASNTPDNSSTVQKNTITQQDAVKPGIYKHYKGKMYEVMGVGHHTETLEPLVMYRALYDTPDFGPKPLWARPVNMFQEKIVYNNIEQLRFTFIKDLEEKNS